MEAHRKKREPALLLLKTQHSLIPILSAKRKYISLNLCVQFGCAMLIFNTHSLTRMSANGCGDENKTIQEVIN